MWGGSKGISEQLQKRGETRLRDAALNTHIVETVDNAAPCHWRDEFVCYPQPVIDTQTPRRAIHIIVDTLSAHTTQKVGTFLVALATVRFHYTPPIRPG